MQTHRIGILQFFKSPLVHRVKTRMQPTLSKEAATELHRRLVEHVATVLSEYEHAQLELWSSADCDYSQDLAQRLRLPLHVQEGEDLGDKLQYAVSDALSRYDIVIAVGSDCPFIDAPYLGTLLEKARNHDVVIGPASDGGYVAIALKQDKPDIFKGIEWGSDRVFLQTVVAVEALSLSFDMMTSLSDIDRPDDLSLLESGKYAHLIKNVQYLH